MTRNSGLVICVLPWCLPHTLYQTSPFKTLSKLYAIIIINDSPQPHTTTLLPLFPSLWAGVTSTLNLYFLKTGFSSSSSQEIYCLWTKIGTLNSLPFPHFQTSYQENCIHRILGRASFSITWRRISALCLWIFYINFIYLISCWFHVSTLLLLGYKFTLVLFINTFIKGLIALGHHLYYLTYGSEITLQRGYY